MTDIVYVVGDSTKTNNNLPLRYSLRSLDKYAKNVGRVFVIGYPPDWLSSEVKTLRVDNIRLGKHWNIANCVYHAVVEFDLRKPFLYSSDDHFLLRTADMDRWPRYCKGTLYSRSEYIAKKGRNPGSYQESIIATRALYDKYGIEPRMLCCHMNTWIDGRTVEYAMGIANGDESMTQFGFEPTCLFALAEQIERGQLTDNDIFPILTDVKSGKLDVIETLRTSVCGAFSLKQGCELERNFVNWFKKNYAEKSRWER